MACKCKPRFPVAPSRASVTSNTGPVIKGWTEETDQQNQAIQLSEQPRAEPFSSPAVDLEKTRASVLSKCLPSSVADELNSRFAIHCGHSMQIFLPHRPARMAWKSLWAGKAQILFHHPNLLTTLLSAENPPCRWIRVLIHTLPELWSRELPVTMLRKEVNVLLDTTEGKIQSLLSYCPALLPEPGGVIAPLNTWALNTPNSFSSPSSARSFALAHALLVLKAVVLGVIDSTGWDSIFLHFTVAS